MEMSIHVVQKENEDNNNIMVYANVYNMFYRGAVAAPVNSAIGSGHWRSSNMLISNVTCTGRESSLLDCPYTVDGSCSFPYAASVVCRNNSGDHFDIF